MDKTSRILITGSSGVIGTALVNALKNAGYTQVLTPTSSDLDLMDLSRTKNYFVEAKPEYVFHLAGRIYGIMGNLHNKGKSYFENTLINTNVIEATRLAGSKKIVAMGTVAIYPDPPVKMPYAEQDLWMGPPHKSEDSYAHSKRAMLAQLEAYKTSYNLEYAYAISTNLYGPCDRFNSDLGHVIPSLVRKFYEAKKAGTEANVWGTGIAERDFLYSADAARALILIMQKATGPINLASGVCYKIKDAVNILAEITNLSDRIVWDHSKPNGQLLRSYDTTQLKELGFAPEYSLEQGLRETYKWYESNQDKVRI